jgi:putative membrane protein
MKTIGKTAVLVAAALALAACGKTYQSAAQRANELGQPAAGLSSDPVVYDSTGAVVSSRSYASRYPATPTYYPYPANAAYYDPYYPSGTVYYPYPHPSGYVVASTVSTQDQQFLRAAMAGSVAEMELARYAYDRADSSAVRQFARQMLDDHARMANHLNAIAVRKGVAPIAISSGVIPGHLAGRSGDDFDEAYMDHMVAEHDRALRLFEQEASTGSDPEIRSAAAMALPTVEAHLDMAERVADEVD